MSRDITHCVNNECHLKDNCYRFLKHYPEPEMYLSISKFEPVTKDGITECDYYIEIGCEDKLE